MFDYSQYYLVIIGLQGFCLFHAYKNNNQQKWYWLIIFLPFIGCLIYLYENFYNRRNINTLTEGVKVLVYNNYALEKLEKEVKYSETITNKMNLAEAYTERGRYSEALKLYESCKTGFYENNPELLQKLLRGYFLNKEYDKAIVIGQQLENVKSGGDMEDKVGYAWALHYTGNTTKAEAKFKALDAKFANFPARIEYAKFLIEIGKPNDAKTVLNAIGEEHEAMDSYEKSAKRGVAREAKRVLQTIKS
jgi:hypothetical protein